MNALPSSTDNISAPARTLKSGGFFSRVEFFEKRLEMEMERERERRGYISTRDIIGGGESNFVVQ